MTKETLVKKLINNEINYNNALTCESKSYYYNLAYILIRQTQFFKADDKLYIMEAIEDSDLYNKVIQFAFARNQKQLDDVKQMTIKNKLIQVKNLITELECLINN